MMTALRVLSLVAAFGLICCAGPATSPEAYTSAETIEAGCSGGLVGFVETVSVHRDGRVDYLLLRAVSAHLGPEEVSNATVESWFAALERAKFFDRDSPKTEAVPDGIGCSISLKGPRFNHSLDVYRGLDPKIRQVFDEVSGLLRR
jgi:hypothetical protein